MSIAIKQMKLIGSCFIETRKKGLDGKKRENFSLASANPKVSPKEGRNPSFELSRTFQTGSRERERENDKFSLSPDAKAKSFP